ncbi:hypothetical protein MRX96_019296 [Rhipicephalus microplus]
MKQAAVGREELLQMESVTVELSLQALEDLIMQPVGCPRLSQETFCRGTWPRATRWSPSWRSPVVQQLPEGSVVPPATTTDPFIPGVGELHFELDRHGESEEQAGLSAYGEHENHERGRPCRGSSPITSSFLDFQFCTATYVPATGKLKPWNSNVEALMTDDLAADDDEADEAGVIRVEICALWATNEITVIKNQTGKLYCNVTLPTGGGVGDENPTQIRWYKGAELIYMLTSEGRNVPIRQMTHRPSASWRDRLQVRTTRLPIWLSIDPVMLHDQGFYQCRVYYGNDVKRNVSHFLRVIEPPENLVIIFGTRPREIRLSPNQKVRQNEGEDLYLECHVIGGKPEPRIRWLESDRKDSVSRGDERVLKLPRVPRRLDNTSYTCEASNNNITEPLSTSVTVLLNLKPVNVSIRNKDTPLKAGVLAHVECESYGSRPAPQFSWWLDGKELVNNSRSVENDLSVLYFEPTIQNNGQKLTCISRNPLIKDSDCVDIWTLDVHFKPQITLLFKGVRTQFVNVTRGATVSLECRTSGNPRTGNITWLLNKQRLPRKTSPPKGVFFRDTTVVDIVNANRNRSGSYSCSGSNAVGSTTSNEVYLRVLYEPECLGVTDTYVTAALDETVRIPCRVAADPSSRVVLVVLPKQPGRHGHQKPDHP